MSASIYFNPILPFLGCRCSYCSNWYDIADDELVIGTLIGLRDSVSQDVLHDYVLVHKGRPIQLLGMVRVPIDVLLTLIDSQYHRYVDPWDGFIFAWGYDIFTGEGSMFYSGTEVLFDIAKVKRTQFKLMSLRDRNSSTDLDLLDVKTGRKLAYHVTDRFWRAQIVRLWRTSKPRLYRPSLLQALTSPLDPITDASAVEYVYNVPWTVPRYDTWAELAALMSYNGPHISALVEDFRNEHDHMDPNNALLGLPEDVILSIVDWLEPETQAVMRRVCRRFENIIRRPVTVTILEWQDERRVVDVKIWEYR